MLNAKAEVTSLATPLLAPMIEEGFFNDQLSQTVIDSYLSNPQLMVLTSLFSLHYYPLIQETIQNYYQGKLIL